MARRSNRRATVAAQVGFGVAEPRPDPAYPRAWTVAGDGLGAWARRMAESHGPGSAQFATGAKARLDEPG